MVIQFQYTITKEDYINFYTYVFWDAKENRKKRIYYYIRQLLPLAVFVFAFYYTGLLDRSGGFIYIVIGLLVVTSLLSFMNVRSNVTRSAEKLTENKENASLFEEKSIEISEKGIILKSALVESSYRWPSIIRKTETREYYYLYTSAIYALIIPKRCFPSPTDRANFDKLLVQQLSFQADFES
jgi:hypothetical protein